MPQRIKYFLMANKQGQTRISMYFDDIPVENRYITEAHIVRKCLSRTNQQSTFFEFEDHKIVYRKYASLYFIAGIDSQTNEMAIYEFIHSVVETLNTYFEDVIMLNLEKAQIVLQEMIANGKVVETCKGYVLQPLKVMDDEEE